jgi:chromosomal replication initiator protein
MTERPADAESSTPANGASLVNTVNATSGAAVGNTSILVPGSRSVTASASEGDRPGSLILPGNRRKFRSFDTLVTGECNSLAVLAARQISATPGERYNPLFVHGSTGTGKTHLLESIYTEIRRKYPSRNVMYLTSEAFTNYFTAALSSKTVPSFRQRFRNVDVLLVDNIEFLDNKRATQEEFLHTIVQLIEHGGQIVVSSDRHPRMLTKHREELTTRFLSGLVCRMESPDDQTRHRLVRALTAGMKAVFCDDALDYLVRRCRKSARELQGALNQLEGQFALNGKRITLSVAREVLGELEDECRRLVRISDVEKVVCEAFGVTASDLRSASRRKAIALPRAIAMFMSRRMTKSAYREIGMYFGGRDHSTVVAAERKIAGCVAAGESVGLPTSCQGRTVGELIDELEQRLLTMAS